MFDTHMQHTANTSHLGTTLATKPAQDGMNSTQTDPLLLQRIMDFPLSDPNAEITFASKLADENAWTLGYATQVELEYRRFLYLSKVAGHTVCPSDDVDQAWHLHLTQTRSYHTFCADVLGEFLHHRESKGGATELQKHRAMYQTTLASYRQVLGNPPPIAIWPGTEKRFAITKDRHAETRWKLPLGLHLGASATVPIVVLAACLAAWWVQTWHGPVFPNQSGPGFLRLYVLALAATAIAILLGRQRQAARVQETTALDPYEAAWLSGGAPRVFTTALASLVNRGVLELSSSRFSWSGARTQCRRTGIEVDARALHVVERMCLDAMPPSRVEAATLTAIARGKLAMQGGASVQVGILRRRLENAGLIFPRGQCSALMGWAVAALSLLLTVAAARLIHGLSELKPIGYLIILLLVNVALLVLVLRHAATNTTLGRRQLAKSKAAHASMRSKAPASPQLFAMGFAIFGLQSGSADPRFDGFKRLMLNNGQSDGADGGSGCSAGGDGAGGCGGGGCGGGGCGG